jgi:predicted NBD/HSP70 family sugar kinase
MSELAAAMDMARSTVAQRVGLLVEGGFVVTSADGTSRRGRPATLLSFDPRIGVILAAHLGMTGARVAVTDLAGTILARRSLDFSIVAGPESVLGAVKQTFEGLLADCDEAHARVMGIGIGLPSMVELVTAGQPRALASPWEDYPIEDHFMGEYGVRTLVDHDVYLMALAEQHFRWPEAEVLLCVKVGTVIGCGVVVAGKVVRGAQAMAGEIGHTRVAGDDTPCWCGNIGCLDAVAGGGALAHALAVQGLPCGSARDVARLAASGVPEAVQVVRRAGRDIGDVIAGAVNLLNPDVIALWGYLTEADEQLFAGIRETIYQRSLPASTRRLQLVRARLGDDAGTTGAAMMVIEDIFSDASVNRLISPSAAQANHAYS